MPKHPPACPVPSLDRVEWSRPGYVSFSLTLKLITPMFGGGAVPRELDKDCPVRAASVRGHLRYWWRALNAGRFATTSELYAAEQDLWGSAQAPGKVSVDLELSDQGQDVTHGDAAARSTKDSRPGPLAYLLFPFKAENGLREASGWRDASWHLDLSLPKERYREVVGALRAWILFGGVGGRTRRGCGALTVTSSNREEFLLTRLEEWAGWLDVASSTGNPLTTNLDGAEIFSVKAEDPQSAWLKLAKFWATFRKGHVMSHKSGRALNSYDGCQWEDHAELLAPGSETGPAIALAKPLLGLPIIYQSFPPNGKDPDPWDGTIEAGDAEPGRRFASPVLLKPYVDAQDKAYAIIVVLAGLRPKTVCVTKGSKTTSMDLLANPQDRVLLALAATDPLEAVGRAAQKAGWKPA